MLERNHLEILREIKDKGSLTAAAESLCLTQPALTHAIKKLEKQLGVSLWVKEGRNLRLTQSGEHILTVAIKILPQFEQAERILQQYSKGQRGMLRIGMECHPCYQWLLKVVEPYLKQWPDVDIDVKQKFTFGGIDALFNYEIDVLVTPDPLFKNELVFEPVFDYEQVLVLATDHYLADQKYIHAEQLSSETLISYPIDIDRLDIYNQFLLPAACSPKVHKRIETTDIILQMVAAGRGVAALPLWLVNKYTSELKIKAVRLGKKGIHKKIYLGTRYSEKQEEYLNEFINTARQQKF